MKITIITVCKNSEQFLQETIDSVISQTYNDIEYIVIDGASIDNTIKIIEDNAKHIHYWISESDNGMYCAINKGLSIATGDYVLILNSDDVLANCDTIETVVKEINKEKLDFYFGNIVKCKSIEITKTQLFNVSYNQLLYSKHCTFVPHPCLFISKNLNLKLGGYNDTFKYASDYDYILRALNTTGVKGVHISTFITKFRLHPNSITASGKINKEREAILLLHGYLNKSKLKRVFYYYILWIYYKIINLKYKI